MVCQLKKAFYGLKQALCVWFQIESLFAIGFLNAKFDISLFVEINSSITILMLVILIIGSE